MTSQDAVPRQDGYRLYSRSFSRAAIRDALARNPWMGWSVGDMASMIDQLTARGVCFTRYEGMEQDERGTWTAPGGAKIAWFLDPDGNNLSLTEFQASE